MRVDCINEQFSPISNRLAIGSNRLTIGSNRLIIGGVRYGHPHQVTLDLLEDADVKIYRTDKNGDIIVKSNRKNISIEMSND